MQRPVRSLLPAVRAVTGVFGAFQSGVKIEGVIWLLRSSPPENLLSQEKSRGHAPKDMLHRVLKRAGLPKVRFHDLRHTFATLALQNGVDIKTVSGMLGHFSAGFTLDTYAHVTTATQKEAANTMEKVLANANI